MILGTAGHIDHGKTALVRALTGVDTDRLPEEKRRGITIELGFAPLSLPGVGSIGIVDVPGHEAFVRTMLAGATGVDLALLVVAVDEGVMPQTREHLTILRLLRIQAGLVALTKCDLPDDDWLEMVESDVRDLVKGSPLAGGPIIRTSVVTGLGIPALKQAIGAVALTVPERNAADTFRMPVDRAFSAKGTGTVATGTVWGGLVEAEDVVYVQPAGRSARVRSVQTHGRSVTSAGSATRAAVGLAGLEVADVPRGSMLVGDPEWKPSHIARGVVALLETVDRPVRPREWVRFHLGTTEVGARIVVGGGALSAGERKPARLMLDSPVLMRAGDRFVLRRGSPPATIGGGEVVDPLPAHRRSKPWPDIVLGTVEHLESIAFDAEYAGIDSRQLPQRLGVASDRLNYIIRSSMEVAPFGGRLFHRAALRSVCEGLTAILRDFHRDHPLEYGLHAAAWKGRVYADASLLAGAEAQLRSDGVVEMVGPLVALRGWVPNLTARDSSRKDQLLQRITQASLEAPSVSELEAEFGSEVEPLLRILEAEHVVVQLDRARYVAVDALELAKRRLWDGMAGGGSREFAASELREILGVSRKYLIPLLEHFDREGVTERRPTGRVLLGR